MKQCTNKGMGYLLKTVSIQVAELGPESEITLIRLKGVLDADTAPDLAKVIDDLLGKKRYNCIIDLGGVEYISSNGWAVFAGCLKEIRQNDGDLKLVQMLPDIYEVFELLEFHRIFRTYSSVEEAMKDFLAARNS